MTQFLVFICGDVFYKSGSILMESHPSDGFGISHYSRSPLKKSDSEKKSRLLGLGKVLSILNCCTLLGPLRCIRIDNANTYQHRTFQEYILHTTAKFWKAFFNLADTKVWPFLGLLETCLGPLINWTSISIWLC